MSIGRKIRKLRQEQDLTLKELAARVGISLSYLSDIERNRSNPSVDTLQSIASALGKPSGYFLDDEKKEAQPDPDEQFFLRAGKLTEDGKKKLYEFLEFVEQLEAKNKRKK
ncbi:MAG: helix-turn-helix transcriptional regulator [Bacillota bacterium]